MIKKIKLVLFILVNSLMLSSCIGGRKISIGEGKRADTQVEKIISAIKNQDKEALKLLFSKKALEEAEDFDEEVDILFDYIQGDIESWEKEGGGSYKSTRNGKSTWILLYSITLKTEKGLYRIFVVDYSIDTINPDSQGVYMLELIENYGNRPVGGGWQERMRAGIYMNYAPE